MNTEIFNTETKTGTFGGTLLVLLFQLNWSNLLQTAVIAAVGAATSFLVSVGLRWLGRRLFKKRSVKEE
jgi:uncharacterized membrane protein